MKPMKGRFFFGIALFLSLALNVFFLGGMTHPRPFGGGHPPMPPFEHMMQNAEQLSEPTRSKVQHIIASYRPALEAQMKQMHASRADLQHLLKSDDYTRAKADAAFEAMQAEMGKMQDIAKKMMLDVNDLLSPTERAQMMPGPHDERADDWHEHHAHASDHHAHANEASANEALSPPSQ